ncbi:hypothetical protein LCGC14_2273350 [marine sediment metagenome]|jgi:chromosome segregation ATPase|uniref:KfrA N-terminal DNA-binding domain-containing protein n=1 Tax=marine sediment metagenome TaxID=412755 RepID=A0A0F9CW96_9ZZZZ|tara:strand:- start:762 stop:1373 length:612 start_codon:yes stop_codon:yes gene_type:complete
MTVTKQRVFRAAGNLTEQGIEPTNRNIRTELGGGSLQTITPLLKEWKTLQEQSADIPTSVASSLESAMREAWAEAKKTAKLAFTGEKNLLEARMAELKDELRLRDETAEGLNAKIVELNKTVETNNASARAAKAQADERIAELKNHLSESKEEAKESRASERELNKQLVVLTAQIAEAKNAAEKAQSEANDANARLTEAAKKQ